MVNNSRGQSSQSSNQSGQSSSGGGSNSTSNRITKRSHTTRSRLEVEVVAGPASLRSRSNSLRNLNIREDLVPPRLRRQIQQRNGATFDESSDDYSPHESSHDSDNDSSMTPKNRGRLRGDNNSTGSSTRGQTGSNPDRRRSERIQNQTLQQQPLHNINNPDLPGPSQQQQQQQQQQQRASRSRSISGEAGQNPIDQPGNN